MEWERERLWPRSSTGRLSWVSLKPLTLSLSECSLYSERHLNSSPLERHVLYPLSFLGLLAITLLALLLVATNSVLLVLYPERCGWEKVVVEWSQSLSLPSHNVSSQVVEEYLLGKASTSHLGLLGSLLEVIVILYPSLPPSSKGHHT